MIVLFIGDLFAKPGRKFLAKHLNALQREYGADATIANVENAAGGFGITSSTAEELRELGLDLMTTGNHVWNKKDIVPFLEDHDWLLRPLNMPAGAPGKGIGYITEKISQPIAVINILGRVFMNHYDCPFAAVREAVDEAREKTPLIIVDFHTEATSEKRAMGWFLDGEVSAVLGTHTHVQTADECILPKGTGYITDVGMTGPHDSVIGIEKETIIERFVTQMPKRFSPASGGLQINAVVLDLDEKSGHCQKIKRILIKDHE